MRSLIVLILCFLSVPLHAAERPNVFFAIADDWGWPHAGAYGNDPVVKTPTFDCIAKQGVCMQRLEKADRARELGEKVLAIDPEHKLGLALRDS